MGAVKFPNEVEENIFSIAVNDLSSNISILNTKFGFYKLKKAMEKLGYDNSPFCVFGPDAGVTRNFERWKSGFGYGCLINWGEPELAFPQMKPNACGMLVAKISEVPNEEELIERIQKFNKKNPVLWNKELKWDLGKSNHFVEILKATESKLNNIERGENLVLMHTSPTELKPLLYDFDKWEERGGKWIETGEGDILVLEGEVADNYYDTYQGIEEFSNKKRELIANYLFDSPKFVSNKIHQGISKPGEIRLGLYDCGEDYFPISLRPDLPIYIVEGKKNIKRDILKEKGIGEKKWLENINILPHGGGYTFNLSQNGIDLIKKDGNRFYRVNFDGRDYIFSNPSTLPYSYRGKEVIEKIKQWDLGKPLVKMKQKYTVKV